MPTQTFPLKRVLFLAVAAIAIIGAAACGLKAWATSAAASYTKNLKAHFAYYEQKTNQVDDQYAPGYQALIDQKGQLSPEAYDAKTVPAAEQYAQAYQPYLQQLCDKQPQLAAVPLGSLLSSDYKQAAQLHRQAQQGFASIVSYGESSIYYYQHYHQLTDVMNRIKQIGYGVQAQQGVVADLSKFAASENLLGDPATRQKLADLSKQGTGYVEAFKQQVDAMPLPPQYQGEKAHMKAVADHYAALQSELATATAKGDAAKMQDVANKLHRHPQDYDFFTAAIAPFQDHHKLYSPLNAESDYFNHVAATIKSA